MGYDKEDDNDNEIYQVKHYCELCGKDKDIDDIDQTNKDRLSKDYDVSIIFKYLSDLMDISPIALDGLIARINHPDSSIDELSRITKRDDRALSTNLKKLSKLKPELQKILKKFDSRIVEQSKRRLEEAKQKEALKINSFLKCFYK